MSSITINTGFKIIKANPIRLIRAGEQKFTDRIPGVEFNPFEQPFQTDDSFAYQFLSAYETHVAELLDWKFDNIVTYPVDLHTQYRNKYFRSDCKVSTLNGKLFIWFDSGSTYEDENFSTANEAFDLEGRMPSERIRVGDTVRLVPEGLDEITSEVLEIAYNPELFAEGFVIDTELTLGTIDGQVEIKYDEKDYDLYVFNVDFTGLDEGNYYLKLTGTLGDVSESLTSDVLSVKDNHEDTLLIKYKHEGEFDFGYIYDDFLTLRVPAKLHIIEPAGKIDTYEDDEGVLTKLNAIPYKQMQLNVFHCPNWMIDILNLLFAHDNIQINNFRYEVEGFGSAEPVDGADLSTFEITLRQVTDRKFSEGVVGITINANFSPTSESFDKDGEQKTVSLVSDSSEDFDLVSKPDWISLNLSTINTSTPLILTASANPDLTIRSGEVLFRNKKYFDLQPSLAVSQDPQDVGEVEYLEASPLSGTIPPSGGGLQLSVNASHPYSISGSYAGFTVQKFSETNVVIIADANNTGSTKTGSVILSLDHNPSIQVTISVTQNAIGGRITSVTPTTISAPATHRQYMVMVNADSTARWSASSSRADMAPVNTSPQIGSKTLNIPVLPNPGGQRTCVVSIINIFDPNNYFDIQITQSSAL